MVTIIIPNHNEENIELTLDALEEYALSLPGARLIVSCDRDGKGKGWAVRQAYEEFLLNDDDIIAIIDGDLDIHPSTLGLLIPHLDKYDVVVGKKQPHALLSRRILTTLSRWYIRFAFGIPVDTQTGIKVFKKKFLPTWFLNSFAYDIEIMRNAYGLRARVLEVPVTATVTKKMKLSAIVKTFWDTLKI